jgi:Ion channel
VTIGRVRTVARRDRYGAVFLLLLATYVVGASIGGTAARLTLLVLYGLVLLLVVRAARPPRLVGRVIRLVLGVGSLVAAGIELAAPGTAEAALLAWFAAVLLVSIVNIVREVLRHDTVTLQTIFGALSAYLLIGFMFAAVYGTVARLGSGPFFAGGEAPNGPTLQYFSFVTLTTTGYGDLTAAGGTARALAVLEALFGQIFLVTLVARLVALFGQARPRRDDSGDPRVG